MVSTAIIGRPSPVTRHINNQQDVDIANDIKMGQMRIEHLIRFYSILDRLEREVGGEKKLADCSGRLDWPQRGVYFFREDRETRSDTGNGPRIVRVGTHALKAGSGTRLWSRLSQHRGHSDGGGNHRGSIFRLIVGTALVRRDKLDFPTWGKGKTAKPDVRVGESPLERLVSEFIGRMSFIWLPVDDAPGPSSQRGYIERNTIALLSNYSKPPIDPPSRGWLGRHSDRKRVRNSGLWNQSHVEEIYSPGFLDLLDNLVA